MTNKFKIINRFPLEDAYREDTDVIEILKDQTVALRVLKSENKSFQVHGPAVLIADFVESCGDVITVQCLRQILYASLDEISWDARAVTANEGIRRHLLRSVLNKTIETLPQSGPQNGQIYRFEAKGGFIPIVPNGWKTVQVNSHFSKWAILQEGDARLRQIF